MPFRPRDDIGQGNSAGWPKLNSDKIRRFSQTLRHRRESAPIERLCEVFRRRFRLAPAGAHAFQGRDCRIGVQIPLRDHELIRRWATVRQAEPATGEATISGPATHHVNDGGAGIRFNFPGVGLFRPISWEEWLTNFDVHQWAFVYEDDGSRPPSNRYRIVKADDWKELLSS